MERVIIRRIVDGSLALALDSATRRATRIREASAFAKAEITPLIPDERAICQI